MTPKRKSIFDWKAVLGIALSVGLLWWAFKDENFSEILHELRQADPLLFVLAAAGATGVFWPRAWRWRTLLEPVAPGIPFRSRFAATTIGFMGNNLLPARIGEFARVYALSRMEKVSIVAGLGSLVVERLFDAVFVIGLLFIALGLPGVPDISAVKGANLTAVANTLAVLIGIAFVLGALLVLFPERSVSFFEKRIARWLPQGIRRPLVDALEAFLSGLGILRSPKLLIVALVQSAILWLFNAVGFWLGFKAFGIDVSFSGALLLQSVIALAVSVPSGPGFFGLFETGALVVLHQLYQIPKDKVLGFAIGFHLAGFIPVTLIGLFYAWRLGISLKEVGKSEETVEEAVEETLPPETKRTLES
ncbi:MAG TPA: lysylphosphatidylglycerol synthase transmembrane domain-containing protein [Longimicrobiales bacterium]